MMIETSLFVMIMPRPPEIPEGELAKMLNALGTPVASPAGILGTTILDLLTFLPVSFLFF